MVQVVSEDKEKKELLKEIANLKANIHDLEKDLIHDTLTSLKTKAFFEEEVNIYLSAITNVNAGKRREWFGFKNLSILFFDIDHFKKINDTYGHLVGDCVLREVALTIKKGVREGDTVARWGGEEIVASLLGASENDAKEKTESIRKEIEKLVFSSIPDLKVTISVGVVNTHESISLDELLRQADKALYKAKETGRNKVVAYSEI